MNLTLENIFRFASSLWKAALPYMPQVFKLGGYVILCYIGWKLWKKSLRPLLRKIQKPERIILLLLAGCMALVLPLDTKELEKLVQEIDFHYIVVALGDLSGLQRGHHYPGQSQAPAHSAFHRRQICEGACRMSTTFSILRMKAA